MSLPNGTSPPARAPVFSNINEQVFSVDGALVMSHNGTFPRLEAPVFSNINGTNQHHGLGDASIIEQNVLFGPNVSHDKGHVNPNVENSSRTKRRREPKSKVWDDFTKEEGEDGKEWALCKHCKKRFVGSSKSGTTHLKNHLERCPKKGDWGRCSDHKTIEAGDSLNTLIVSKKKSKVNQELNNLDETRMIIKYWRSSLGPIKDDILNVFKEEKEKLQRYFSKLPCRFTVTVECCDLDNYLFFMVVHYIDDGWELKKRIIHLQMEEYDSDFVQHVLQDWNMDKNICCYYEDPPQRSVSTWLNERGSFRVVQICFMVSLLLEGFELSMWIRGSKLRNWYTEVQSAKSEVEKGPPVYKIPTFELLEWAMRYKENFGEQKHEELNWDEATAEYECCKVIEDIARSLSDRLANECLPFFCDVLLKIFEWQKSENVYIREIAECVREDFHAGWERSSLAYVIAAILDPRHKMEIIKYTYMEIYGNDADMKLKEIINAVKDIYNIYANATNKSKSSTSGRGDSTSTFLKKLHAEGRLRSSSQYFKNASPKSEFDLYLEDYELIHDDAFNILGWWNLHSSTYPTLSKMARDFLSMPSSYSNELLDSSLKSQIGEIFNTDLNDDLNVALACTKVWLNDVENE